MLLVTIMQGWRTILRARAKLSINFEDNLPRAYPGVGRWKLSSRRPRLLVEACGQGWLRVD